LIARIVLLLIYLHHHNCTRAVNISLSSVYFSKLSYLNDFYFHSLKKKLFLVHSPTTNSRNQN